MNSIKTVFFGQQGRPILRCPLSHIDLEELRKNLESGNFPLSFFWYAGIWNPKYSLRNPESKTWHLESKTSFDFQPLFKYQILKVTNIKLSVTVSQHHELCILQTGRKRKISGDKKAEPPVKRLHTDNVWWANGIDDFFNVKFLGQGGFGKVRKLQYCNLI